MARTMPVAGLLRWSALLLFACLVAAAIIQHTAVSRSVLDYSDQLNENFVKKTDQFLELSGVLLYDSFQSISDTLLVRHNEALRFLQSLPPGPNRLQQLKAHLDLRHPSEEWDVDLVDKSYHVVDTSHEPDRFLDLNVFPQILHHLRQAEMRDGIDIAFPVIDGSGGGIHATSTSLTPDRSHYLRLTYRNLRLRKIYTAITEFLSGFSMIRHINVYLVLRRNDKPEVYRLFAKDLRVPPEALPGILHAAERDAPITELANGPDGQTLAYYKTARPQVASNAWFSDMQPVLVYQASLDPRGVKATLHRAWTVTLLVLIAGLLAILTLHHFLSQRIVKPLRILADGIERGEPPEDGGLNGITEFRRLRDGCALQRDALASTRRDHTEQLRELRQECAAFRDEARQLRSTCDAMLGVIDSMPSILIIVDRDGRVRDWNREAQRLSPVPLDRARGYHLSLAFPQLREGIDQLARALRSREVLRMGKYPFSIGGKTQYVDVTVYPLADDDGGAVIRVDNVTEEARREEILSQADKMLSVCNLSAGMAHELNNPLGIILQSIQGVLRRISDHLPANKTAAEEAGTNLPAVRDYLERRNIQSYLEAIRDAATRAARIVEGMPGLDPAARTAHGAHRLGDLVEGALRRAAEDPELTELNSANDAHVRREMDPTLPEIICNAFELEQAIFQIVRNAALSLAQRRQIGERGWEPILTLRSALENDFAVLEIRDNGVGMDESNRRQVFDPFFTTRRGGEGLGMGMSMAFFTITRLHGGTLTVESRPGRGAAFVARLPVFMPGNDEAADEADVIDAEYVDSAEDGGDE